MDLSNEQPMPTPNDSVSVQAMVRADLEAREAIGRERYGTALQPHNGRDALRDAYEECLDMACYLRQAIEERGIPLSGLEFPHVGSVSGTANGTTAPLDVHASSSMTHDGLAFPSSDRGEHLVDLRGSATAHQGVQGPNQGNDVIDTAVLPGPGGFPVGSSGHRVSNSSGSHDSMNATDDVLVGHGHQHTDQRARCSVKVTPGSQVEASLTFQQSSEPGLIEVIHSSECTQTFCAALDLACYLRQAIEERG